METKYGLCFLLTAVGRFLPGKLELSIHNQSNSGIYKMRPSQGFGGTEGTGGKGVYFRRTGKQRPKFEENKEQRQYWGTGNIRKQILDFGGTGEQTNLFQWNKGTGTPWEGL